jgi:glycosyltransferase involved in cell wall biosynthesis
MNLKINWICELPTHYNDFIFNRLSEEKKVDLTVFYIYKNLDSHPWKKSERIYNHFFFRTFLKIDFNLVLKSFIKKDDLFILGGWRNPTIVLIILIRFLLNGKYVIWTDTPRLNKNNYIRKLWISLVLKNSFSVWGTGEPAVRNLIHLGSYPFKTFNLPYILNNSFYRNFEKKENFNDFIFLSSGRLINKHKGFDLAIKALGLLHNKYPQINFKYFLAGVGADYQNLLELTKEVGISQNVVFLGWLDLDELIKFYHSGDYFLHPARFEPFGVSVIEAMAAGLIVLSSKSTVATLDRINDGVNGYMHNSNNVDDLFFKLEEIIQLSQIKKEEIINNSINTSEMWDLSIGIKLIYQYLCVE